MISSSVPVIALASSTTNDYRHPKRFRRIAAVLRKSPKAPGLPPVSPVSTQQPKKKKKKKGIQSAEVKGRCSLPKSGRENEIDTGILPRQRASRAPCALCDGTG